MEAKYVVKKDAGGWQVWDLHDNQALASFETMADAETCRAACELARRDAMIEGVRSKKHKEACDSEDDLEPEATRAGTRCVWRGAYANGTTFLAGDGPL